MGREEGRVSERKRVERVSQDSRREHGVGKGGKEGTKTHLSLVFFPMLVEKSEGARHMTRIPADGMIKGREGGETEAGGGGGIEGGKGRQYCQLELRTLLLPATANESHSIRASEERGSRSRRGERRKGGRREKETSTHRTSPNPSTSAAPTPRPRPSSSHTPPVPSAPPSPTPNSSTRSRPDPPLLAWALLSREGAWRGIALRGRRRRERRRGRNRGG